MSSPEETSQSRAGGGVVFATTHWSVVLAAGQHQTRHSQEALSKLCQTYWYPLYAFVRRQGCSPHDAQDLTQEFFARFLEGNRFARADPERGRFRAFLLTSMKNFLGHEWQKARAAKRGGPRALLSLSSREVEERYQLEPVAAPTADKLYERRWALTLLDQVLERLRQDYAKGGKAQLFEELKAALQGERVSFAYGEVAARLGMHRGAVKVAVHRLRQRYGEFLREEISHTVARPEDIDGELRYLFEALSA